MSSRRCQCGGGRAHHENDVACWCPACLAHPVEDRCTEYSPHIPVVLPKPPAAPQGSSSGKIPEHREEPPTTSLTLVYQHIVGSGGSGVTLEDLATRLRLRESSVTQALHTLKEAGSISATNEPRQLAEQTGQLWLATGCPYDASPKQATLWD